MKTEPSKLLNQKHNLPYAYLSILQACTLLWLIQIN